MALTDNVEAVPRVWADDNPYYLIIVLDDGRAAQIDLGERGWIAKYSELGFTRDPGRWHLARKDGTIAGAMQVFPGEQPYYVARHVGIAGSGGSAERTAYGIGKKRLDGHVDRLWFMANGCVTLGDDLESITVDLIKKGQL